MCLFSSFPVLAEMPLMETFIIIANTTGASADMLLQDLINSPVDQVASEMAAAVAPLSDTLQKRIIKALRAFSENIE